MTNKMRAMHNPRTLLDYTRRFSFTVGTAVSMHMVSTSGNLSYGLPYYARLNYLPSEYAFVAGMSLLLVLCIGLALVALGFRSGPALLASVAVLNLLLSAHYLGNNRVTLFSSLPLFQSLFCLVLLNTRNHRRYVSMLRVKRRRKSKAGTSPV